MAKKRMFSIEVVASDAFLDMPLSTRALYFHLGMYGDDDGFVNNPKTVQRLIGASDDDFKLLIAKRFIIPFDSGVTVIKHWRLNNYIQSDRYYPTVYQDEYSQLIIKKNEAYTLKTDELSRLSPNEVITPERSENEICIQTVSKMYPQIRLDEIRLEELKTQQEQQQTEILSRFRDISLSEIAKLQREERKIIESIAAEVMDAYFGRKPQKVDTARIYGYLKEIWRVMHCPDDAPTLVFTDGEDDPDEDYEDKRTDLLELLKHAFDMSARAQKPSFEYVEMVIATYRTQEIKSVDDLYKREVERDFTKRKI
ncbi:MAG: hypothetical protein RR235_08245 [Oscillospiraceae bacterium]